MKLLIRLLILATIISVFTVRCANQGSLEGGNRDSLPPVIVRTTPKNYATNFNGKKISLEFNEYIQLKDQSKLFFVSPPGEQKPKLTIKGKVLEVLFEKELDSAQTYRLDFGSSIVDNNEGNKMDGYFFVFSTGSHIDSLVMAGQAIGAYERDSVANGLIFFFDPKADSQEADSTMFNGKAEVISRTDSSGYFIADILKDKDYLIYALDDTNGNHKYEPGTDRIGFSNKVFNPSKLDGFTMVYDSTRRYMKIDPLQVKFDLFKEIPVRRQMLSKQERPLRQKIIMSFNSSKTVIDSIELEGIDPSWIIRDNGIVGDSVTLWIAPPTKVDIETLKDSIVGTLLLERQDSLWQPYMSKEKLIFWHQTVQPEKTRAEKRAEAAKLEKPQPIQKPSRKRGKNKTEIVEVDSTATDSLTEELIVEDDKIKEGQEEEVPQNKFKFRTIAEQTLNPENHIVFEFDFPLRYADSTKMELIHKQKITTGRGRDIKEEIKEVKAKFTISKDPGSLHRWIVRSDWKPGDEYKLTIMPKAFEDITFESNDSLTSEFTIATPDKFGELIIKTQADSTDQNTYIYELLTKSGAKYNITSRKTGIKAGQDISFAYLKPGNYYVRIIQDVDGNGKWDTGSLTERRPPEKVRMVTSRSDQDLVFIVKENWQMSEKVDLKKLFKD